MVIGNHVPDVYAEILQVGGLPAGGSLDLDEGDAPKGNLFDRFVSLVSSIFQPFPWAFGCSRDYQRYSCYHDSMWLVSYNESYVCYLECSRR